MKNKKIAHVASLITCLLMVASIAITRDHKLWGHDIKLDKEETPTERTLEDGTVVVSTAEIGKEIIGYGGPTPLEIHLKDGVITDVIPLANSETPDFFSEVTGSGMFQKWIGKTPEEALQTKVDAVSGATYSSDAVIQNVKAGLQYVIDNKVEITSSRQDFTSVKFWVAVLVILAGSILPMFVHNRYYRIVQQTLNVLVLGFWCGTFISYSLLISSMSNGISLMSSILTVMLLIVAFVFPLFGKKNHYCAWICPLGSIQELAGKTIKYKYRMSQRTVKYLRWFRQGLWALLMLLLWSGVMFELVDYELFTAFIFTSAPIGVSIVAVLFVLVSLVIPRPYCRFVCPTGTLLRISQNNE